MAEILGIKWIINSLNRAILHQCYSVGYKSLISLAALIIAHRIVAAWTFIIKRNIFTAFYFHEFFELAKLAKIKRSPKFLVLQYNIL